MYRGTMLIMQPLGEEITTNLLYLAASLNVSTPLGTAPHDFFLSRYPQGHPNSVITEFAEKVLPAVVVDPGRRGTKKVIIGNTGTLRFDVVSRVSSSFCPRTF